MTVVPIPRHELKPNTWYYGIQCVCTRLLALTEDCFAGRGDEPHPADIELSIPCECGEVIRTHLLHKLKTP